MSTEIELARLQATRLQRLAHAVNVQGIEVVVIDLAALADAGFVYLHEIQNLFEGPRDLLSILVLISVTSGLAKLVSLAPSRFHTGRSVNEHDALLEKRLVG
jgi:hypothetical protein